MDSVLTLHSLRQNLRNFLKIKVSSVQDICALLSKIRKNCTDCNVLNDNCFQSNYNIFAHLAGQFYPMVIFNINTQQAVQRFLLVILNALVEILVSFS